MGKAIFKRLLCNNHRFSNWNNKHNNDVIKKNTEFNRFIPEITKCLMKDHTSIQATVDTPVLHACLYLNKDDKLMARVIYKNISPDILRNEKYTIYEGEKRICTEIQVKTIADFYKFVFKCN